MSNPAINSLIECPFFESQDKNYICCESFVKDTECKIIFKNADKKKRFLTNVCSVNQGKGCPHYRTMQILYERGMLK